MGESRSEKGPLAGLQRQARRIVNFAGLIAAFVFLPGLTLSSMFDIVTRRFLQLGSTPIQELTWHFFFACVMFGLGSTYLSDKHVRVDIVRERLSPRIKARLERFLIVILLIPLLLIVIWFGVRMTWISFLQDEGSRASLGLSSRWIVKSTLPIGAFLLFLAACCRLVPSNESR